MSQPIIEIIQKELQRLAKRVAELESQQKPKEWLTLAEVKEEYGYEPGTIYQLNHASKITTRKAGGLQVSRKSIEAYIKNTYSLSVDDLMEREKRNGNLKVVTN